MKPALYLLDGYSIIYRSYFAFIRQPLRNPQGRNSSAVFGFFRTLFSLLNERNPELFAVAMDSKTPTFRDEMYPEYKANRQKTPEDLHAQIPIIEEMLAALRMPVIRVDGVEADDVMASLAERCRAEKRPCFIISGDKDLLQLVGGPVKVLRPEKGSLVETGPDEVREAWGVSPGQMLDYLSLVGDASDNIPGAKGIGEKTAVALLGQFAGIDELYAGLDKVASASQRAKLEAARDEVMLSRRLVTLKRDLALPAGPESLSVRELDRAALAPLLLREGMKGLAEEAAGGALAQAEPAAKPRRAAESEEPGRSQGELFTAAAPAAPTDWKSSKAAEALAQGRYVTIRDEAGLDLWIEKARRAGQAAFDTETTDLDPYLAELVGFSLAVAEGEACYVPVKAPGGAGLGLAAVLPRLAGLLTDPKFKIIGQNIKFDYKIMKRLGLEMANPAFDTMLAAWVLDAEAGSFNMDRLAEAQLDYRTIHFDQVVPRGATFEAVELDAATAYAAEDADVTYRLYRLFAPRLAERGLDKVFFQLEMPLVRVLAEMELLGIRILPDELKAFGRELERDLAGLEIEIYRLCGREFNINSTKQLQEILFQVRKLKPAKKTKTGGGYSTDNSVLEELAREDPVPEKILAYRNMSKLKSTYAEALPRLVNPVTGRLHTSFVQTGTATGRVASRDPNLQNIPIRDELGRRIRGSFVPEPGWLFMSADYSQIELVVLAHLSGDPALAEAFISGRDVHRRTAALIFGVEEPAVTNEQRRAAKTINFGVIYGMSAFRLARDLGIPRAEAERFIQSYFGTYARVREFIDKTVRETEKTGRVGTLMGRERPIAAINSRNHNEKSAAERIAVNTPIQGSAADIVKLAMLRVTARLAEKGLKGRLLLQVHDELIFELPPEEKEAMTGLVRGEMEAAAQLSVPLRVTIETGSSWGELH